MNYMGFDISRRVDGRYAVWDYGWYPDPDLDSDPEANKKWLRGTMGWRAKGWVLVYVAKNYRDAHNWIHARTAKQA